MNEVSKKLKVLLAEDGDDHARIITAVLSRAGYEIVRVSSGIEAHQLIAGGTKFDLLLTDIMMPGMSGFELLTRLKAEGIMPKTIVLTGKQGEEDVLRGLESGALDYIAKPFSPSVVLARVKLALERKAA